MSFFILLFIAAVLVFVLEHRLRTAHQRKARRTRVPAGWDKV
jgi:hypothetical protein